MKVRKVIAILMLALSAAVCAICAADGKTPPKTAQELVIGEQFDLGGFDPASGMLDDAQILAYNALVELDANFKKVPGLAESWEMSADGLTWTFHLRRGVTFHDGEKFNAAAAIANLRGRLDGYPATRAVQSYDAPDDYTLILRLTQPVFTLDSDLARTAMSMASPKAIKEDGSLAYEAGTGPYRLASHKQDQEYSFVAYDGYWGGPVNIKKITFKVITDAQSRAMALESGEIDMMSGYQSLAAIRRLKDDPRFAMFVKTQNTSGVIFFNMERGAVKSPAVRRAIAQSIDFDAMIPALLPGLAAPPSGFFSPAYGAFISPNAKNPAYDPAGAAAALAADGWTKEDGAAWKKDGESLAVTLTYSAGNSEDSLLAPAIQSELLKTGISVTLNGVDGATLGDLLDAKDYEMVLTGQSFIPTDDPTFHYANGYWHSGSYYRVHTSTELDAMIESLQTSMNAAARLELHHKIQEKIMELTPVIVAYHRNSVRLARANITNFDIGAGCWHVNYDLKNAQIR
jgi:ABC-type transport system substrate-binding protein